MFKGIDLSSDIATEPNLAMREAMFEAKVDNEQKGKAPTTRKLEKMIARLFNFSGTTLSLSIKPDNNHYTRLLTEQLLHASSSIRLINALPTNNIVYFEWINEEMSAEEFHVKCISNGVRFMHVAATTFCAIVNSNISRNDIFEAVKIVKMVCNNPILATS